MKSKKQDRAVLPKNYDINFINSNIDLTSLSESLARKKSARVCIFGASGTGKSAYAAYLANVMKKELIIKRASDILNYYVAESEKNIARAEVRKKGAILLFDEVDTFLYSRNFAQRSFEISQTNEMLTQMEKFDGIFIATTNLFSSLDRASLRRFDIKLEFGFLSHI